VNRLRDRLSGMFNRAQRLGLVGLNPVKGIPKLKEAGGRVAFLSPIGERALLTALSAPLRPLVTLALHTGLRWSEEAALRWKDTDLYGDFVAARVPKNGKPRRVPLNRTARAALVDLSSRRRHPFDPDEPVVRSAYRTVSREFVRAVRAAQESLRASNQLD